MRSGVRQPSTLLNDDVERIERAGVIAQDEHREWIDRSHQCGLKVPRLTRLSRTVPRPLERARASADEQRRQRTVSMAVLLLRPAPYKIM